MREPGSGSTSGLTNWNNMDVNSMWAAIGDHHTDNHWRQVAGWRKTSELAMTHLSRLREYRRGLAQAWPPEKSAAARTYLNELDLLIDTVQRTYDAAVANYTALAAATSAISSTRTELKKLHDQYAEKLWLKQTYEATLVPPPGHRGPALVSEPPPVTDAELDKLNSQARTLMYGLGNELQQAQAMLKPPPPPLRFISNDPARSDLHGVGAPPLIPPIAPVPLAASRSVSQPRPSAIAAQPVATPEAPGIGPVLGGTGSSPLPPKVNPATPLAPSTSSPAAGISPGALLPLSPAPGSLAKGPLDIPGKTGAAAPAGRPHPGGTSAAPRPMPPGGLIGGMPGMGIGQPAPGSPVRRVNPIGGVIGGGAGTAPSGGAGSRPSAGRGPSIGSTPGMAFGGAPSMARPISSAGPHERNDRPHRWDPDNPWQTAQGVQPVVRPPAEDGPIDPGPAIGFNR